MEKKKILFIDRDGTLIREPEDEQVDDLSKLSFVPGAIGALSRIVSETDYRLVMVTNQDGLGTEAFPEETFWPAHRLMLDTFEGEGVRFDQVLIDRSFPQDDSPGRKPRTGMVERYLNEYLDTENSYVIGDRRSTWSWRPTWAFGGSSSVRRSRWPICRRPRRWKGGGRSPRL